MFIASLIKLSNDLGGCSLEQDGENFYIVGADSVRKKLGSQLIWVGTRVASGNYASTFDCKTISGYQNLTNDSFVIIPNGTAYCRCKGEIGDNRYTTCTATLSYNPNTGILTTGLYGYYQPYTSTFLYFDIGYDIYAVI